MEVSLRMVFTILVLVLVFAFVVLFLKGGSNELKSGILGEGTKEKCTNYYGKGDWGATVEFLSDKCDCDNWNTVKENIKKSDPMLYSCCDYFCWLQKQ